MTITCTCPQCDRFCGFKDAHAGRGARCLHCNAHFTVPERDGEAAYKISETPTEPLEGFYRAVLRDNFNAFIQKESIFGLILCTALVCFHFFAGDKDYSFTLGAFRPPLAVGWLVTFCCAGYLLWYCMETINITATGDDILPEIFIGAGFVFIGQAVKSIYLFIAAFAIAAIPGAVAAGLLRVAGVSSRWLNIGVLMLSLSMLPMILCMLGAGVAEWNVFRYDRIIRMIAKTPGPYLLTMAITFVGLIAVALTVGLFSDRAGGSSIVAGGLLLFRLAAVCGMLFAMRTLGLYARYYLYCYSELFDI